MKRFTLALILFIGLGCYGAVFAAQEPLETIFYDISPIGHSEYRDMGIVEFMGKRVNLVVFKTNAAGFEDTEKIYSDPATNMPLKVERYVTTWFDKEYLVEDYDAQKNTLTINKFVHGRKVKEYFFKGKGPIHNAILLPFSLRKVSDLKIGWSCDIRLPQEFKVKIVGIEDVVVKAGKFKAYHITSNPAKFEMWISNDSLRLPLLIKGLEGLSYTLKMRRRIVK